MSEKISTSPEAVLRFSLPEHEGEFRRAIDAPRMQASLFEFSQWLRNKQKYGEQRAVAVEEVSRAFWDIVQSNGVSNFAD